jgi:hypothetical protein
MEYQIRALGVGGILDEAIKLMKNRFGLFMGIACCIQVPYNLIVSYYSLAIQREFDANATDAEIAAYFADAQSGFITSLALGLVGWIVAYPLSNAAMIHAVSHEYLGRPVSVGSSLASAFRRLVPLLWTSVLMWLAVYVGFIFCIIPGIYFLIRYSMSSFAVVIDGLNGPAALRRSKDLLLADRTTNYNTVVLLGILLFVIAAAIQTVPPLALNPYLAVAVSSILQGVNSAYGTAALAVFYFSCRCKAENFDLTLLAEAMEAESSRGVQ